jgi:hypothetical protein
MMKRGYVDNINTECAVYPETNNAVIVNNTGQSQQTIFYDLTGNQVEIKLNAYESKWLEL